MYGTKQEKPNAGKSSKTTKAKPAKRQRNQPFKLDNTLCEIMSNYENPNKIKEILNRK